MKFEDMSNDLILCIWDQLFVTDVIYSFSNLNSRIHQLLLQFYGLYKQLDLRYCSLRVFRYFCHQLSTMDEWRLHLTSLKLGNRYRCSQTNLLANAVAHSFVARYLARQGKQCLNPSKDLCRLLMSYTKHRDPFFPQLKSLFIFQSTCIDQDSRDIILQIIASGSAMRTFTWRACSYQTHNSRSFFDWLFRCSVELNSYRLESPLGEKSFELTYQHTIMNGYRPHQSLTHLTINLLNLSSLDTLLHYLPKLQYLDLHISNTIEQTNVTDGYLPDHLNHPEELCTFKLRHLSLKDKGRCRLEQLVEKFAQSLENLSLSMYHRSENDPDLYYNGFRLQIFCEKLSHLRSIQFAIQVQLFEKPDNELLSYYTRTFSTPFWLNGPFGCQEVCVDFHQLYRHLQMFSLPYKSVETGLIRTVNLINMQFNTSKEESQIPTNLPRALEPLWSGMTRLFISLAKNQKIPLSFIQALQYSRRQGKILALIEKRGIMPDNVEDQLQLTHFNTLELDGFTEDDTYDLQELLAWLRLLPNIRCLKVNLIELKDWLTIIGDNQYLHSFLQHVEVLYMNCSCIINAKMNEEIMESLLLFLLEKDRFPRLRCLRFLSCKNISSAWDNINQWLSFILTRITEHQLSCVRFDFIEKEHEVTELQTGDETIATTDPPCVFDIHRFVHENHVALWIGRK